MALSGKKYFYAMGCRQAVSSCSHVPRYPSGWESWPKWAKASFTKGFRDNYNCWKGYY